MLETAGGCLSPGGGLRRPGGPPEPEICHQKFDDLSITQNTIVPTAPIEWSDVDDKNSGPCRLEWRTDADPRLAALSGCQLKGIALLEWRDHIPDFGNGSLAITFDFGLEQFTIANGLDENALEFGEPDSHYRVYRLNS